MGNSERNLPIETLMDIPSFISNVDKYQQAVQDLTIYHTRPSGLILGGYRVRRRGRGYVRAQVFKIFQPILL